MTSFSSVDTSEGLNEDWKAVYTDERYNVGASCSLHSDVKNDDDDFETDRGKVDPSLEHYDRVASEAKGRAVFLEAGKSEFDTQHLQTVTLDTNHVPYSEDDSCCPLEGDVYVVKSEAESSEPFDQDENWDVMSVDSDATICYRSSGRMEMEFEDDFVKVETTNEFESSGTKQERVSPVVKKYGAVTTSAVNSTISKSQFFECKKCQAVFRTKSKLRTHKCALTTYECGVCRATFPEKWRLRRHSLVHFRSFKCSVCCATLSSRNALKEHALTHTAARTNDQEDQNLSEAATPGNDRVGTTLNCRTKHDKDIQRCEAADSTSNKTRPAKRMFKCAECDATLTTRGNLTIHQKRHAEVGPHKCSGCGMSFKRLSGLISHEFRKHKDSKAAKLCEQESFTCGHCDASFRKLSTLKNHLIWHVKPYDKTELEEKKGEGGFYPCQWCHKSFEEFRSLKKHESMHEGVCAFVCDECGAPLNSKANLTRHRCRTRNNSSFPKPERNNVSKPKSTSNIKPFNCEECGVTRLTRDSLMSHQRIHTGERPYLCPVCPATFRDRSGRNRHKRMHSGERPHGCAQCPSRFASKQHLTRHLKAHNNERNEVCPDCHKRFITKGQLKVHLRKHTGDRPFVCSICSASFIESGRLLRHYNTHEGNHVCDTCGARFKIKSRLDLHVVTHKAIT